MSIQYDIEDPPFYTPQQVADWLNCSKVHVYRLINSGALKHIDIAKPGALRTKKRIREQDLMAYVATMQETAKKALATPL